MKNSIILLFVASVCLGQSPDTIITSVNDYDRIVKFYPNPFTDKINSEFDFEILNTFGVRIGDQNYDVSKLASGMYFIRFRYNNRIIIRRAKKN